MAIALNQPNPVMEPILAYDLHDEPGFIYQVKWDGVRILCHLDKSQIRLWNKRLHERTLQYPELQQAARCFKADNAIVDGEAVALKNGKPSFPAVMSRDNCRTAASVKRQSKNLTVDYMIFDLLYLNGRALTDFPLRERKQMLAGIFLPRAGIHLIEDFQQGTSLYQAVKEQAMEGIVAKLESSRYVPGKHHKSWFKYKNRLRATAVVGALLMEGQRVKSLLLGLYHENHLVYIGRAGTGLNEEQRLSLFRELSALKSDTSPFRERLSLCNLVYLKPVLTVLVEFAEWSEDLRLRSPVILGFSDQAARACRLFTGQPE